MVTTINRYFFLGVLITAVAAVSSWARRPIPSYRFEQLSGVKKSEKSYWDKKYSKSAYVFGKVPAKFLANYHQFIPPGSRVLDVGMGEGRNAVFLAKKDHRVTGIDISSMAVAKANRLAKEFGVRIKTIVASLNEYNFAPEVFDAIICFYYVDRSLNKKMVKWLRPGGILIYESYTDAQRSVEGFEHHNKKYLLRESELLGMFPGMRVLLYAEPLHEKNYISSIILQKK